MIKAIIASVLTTAFLSCTRQSGSDPSMPPANLDSLASTFVAAWNDRDSTAIASAIADNAILMTDSLVYRGLSEISDHWISGGVKAVSNLKTSPLVQDSDNSIAYSAGTYTHDLTLPGAEVFSINGNYSFAWKRQAGGAWKLMFIHIEDLTR